MPANLSLWWNLGSFLGLVLVVQVGSGILFSFLYSSSVPEAFFLLTSLTYDTWWSWVIRFIHMNGATLFFVALYLHLGRGLFYTSFMKDRVWWSGSTLVLLLMGSAFLGYLLPWGQMSYWGATVITNLTSVISGSVPIWLWGDFSVSSLAFFYSLHYLLPLILVAVAALHLLLLHLASSSAKTPPMTKTPFSSHLLSEDLLDVTLLLTFFLVVLLYPSLFEEEENSLLANPAMSPVHIKPEWYFLASYAILRSVPNKLGGVIGLAMSVLVLYLLPLKSSYKFLSPLPLALLILSMFILTWIGGLPVEDPYIIIGQLCSLLYFLLFPLL